MAKLPIVSGTEAVKALKRLRFFVDRQRGSHVVVKKVIPELIRSRFSASVNS
jgi:predicted RNA binding protein YcfA (HicA-like mRNA interferase family)